MGAVALVGTADVAAQAPGRPLDETRLRAAIAEAEQARAAAAEALQKADDAIAILKRSLPAEPAAVSSPKSATELRAAETKRAPVPRPATMPACDAGGSQGSIGDYMVQTGAADRQKKESSYSNEPGTNAGINAFVYHCLGLTRATDYETITNLSAQFTGTKGSEQIEAVLSRTARALKTAASDRETAYAATYNRYWVGGFGRTGSSGDAPLIDLTESNFASGVGIVGGFEWGRMPAVPQVELVAAVHRGLAKARQECVLANSLVDPLTNADGAPGDRPRLAPDPISRCVGDELVKWMSQPKRANQYWTDIVSPLWGYKGTPEAFAGVQARYAFQKVSYRPVIDPKTGAVIVTTLPPAEEIHPRPFSVKLYGGLNRPLMHNDEKLATVGPAASLTYRREVDFIEGTSGKTICTPAVDGATFHICKTDQKLAAPYTTTGFVAGIGLNLQLRRYWYLPAIAIAPRFTYAFDTERPGIEVPVFLLTDPEGKLNSGVKYTCRFRGETEEGLELKKSCNINLFVGTSFEINRTP
ncbi:hypothetical protein [Sphingomonas sp.]|uniref:hypothetical protein n=1 Tax=Sphingomonas sp. TaxID=28214 RepID=UPI00183EFB28|nr:hypothetical protein [Sphingomonas sp.]MBA3512307.1 hypothetical protein [Sphingomonas sp.]